MASDERRQPLDGTRADDDLVLAAWKRDLYLDHSSKTSSATAGAARDPSTVKVARA
jgi:hypothetical protein